MPAAKKDLFIGSTNLVIDEPALDDTVTEPDTISLTVLDQDGSAVTVTDMAAWDALAKAADLPLCVLLGGSVGPVKSYNSNGLWLKEPQAVADELPRIGDAVLRLSNQAKTAVRQPVFGQGIGLLELLHRDRSCL